MAMTRSHREKINMKLNNVTKHFEKYQPQLYVTSIFNHTIIRKLIPSSNTSIEPTMNTSELQNVKCSISDSYSLLNNNFISNNNTPLIPDYNLTLSNDWSYFLKINLENYIDKAYLFNMTLIPQFKLHGNVKSIKHLHNCYEPYSINQLQLIGQYHNPNNIDDDKLNVNYIKEYSIRNIPNQKDCEKLCWAIRQPYLYKNGGLWLWDKKYRILYADYNQTLMAIEQSGVNEINLNTFTATRLQIPSEEYLRSEEGLHFVMLIGFHRQDREQAKCNAAIMGVMDLLRKKLTPYSM
ncbi:unnamed protein product [Schistosoma haematobium]|nr:unnamed protein product [Schistosoma haematobium]